MVGIVSYGAYIPRYRLGKETTGWGLSIEKPVATFDEDSITMAVAAGLDSISGLERNGVDALFFATTTSPYIEKQGAAMVAAAIDLGRNVLTSDTTNSLRAGTNALRSALDAIAAGSARQAMVSAVKPFTCLPRYDIRSPTLICCSKNGVRVLLYWAKLFRIQRCFARKRSGSRTRE